jgi:L-lysine 6-transaminase
MESYMNLDQGYNPEKIPHYYVEAANVIDELKNYMLIDGFPYVIDLEHSRGANFIDARTGKKYLDFFTCFASMPIGFNHPKMLEPQFLNYLQKASLNKISNSDLYSDIMATFVKTFFNIAVPPAFKYSFFISGGALAVENALKTAFDWKVRKNIMKYKKARKSKKMSNNDLGSQIIHFQQAFHGRSGYTMSLTNTDPAKTDLFPKFNWPRIINPKLRFPITEDYLIETMKIENEAEQEIKQAFLDNKDDIAGIIIEPIQGEGGDNHFRPEFLKKLRQLADENEALLIYDEVQTGLGLTGKMWAYENLGVTPDILCFGKKTQICGIIVTNRIDDVPENVFHTSSRINSTWGGNLTDMARSTRYLEIIMEENLLDNVNSMSHLLMKKLNNISDEFPELVSNVRGRGLFTAFDFPGDEIRSKFLNYCYDNGLLILKCGEKSIRFRPPLNLKESQLEEGIEIIINALKTL